MTSSKNFVSVTSLYLLVSSFLAGNPFSYAKPFLCVVNPYSSQNRKQKYSISNTIQGAKTVPGLKHLTDGDLAAWRGWKHQKLSRPRIKMNVCREGLWAASCSLFPFLTQKTSPISLLVILVPLKKTMTVNTMIKIADDAHKQTRESPFAEDFAFHPCLLSILGFCCGGAVQRFHRRWLAEML